VFFCCDTEVAANVVRGIKSRSKTLASMDFVVSFGVYAD